MSLFAKQETGVSTAPLFRKGDTLVFPGMSLALSLDTQAELSTVQVTLAGSRLLVVDVPELPYRESVVAGTPRIASLVKVLQVMKLPNRKGRALIEGVSRVELLETVEVAGVTPCGSASLTSTTGLPTKLQR